MNGPVLAGEGLFWTSVQNLSPAGVDWAEWGGDGDSSASSSRSPPSSRLRPASQVPELVAVIPTACTSPAVLRTPEIE